jgi:hypothetical protein
VTVVEARNLLAKDDDGASDPYCEVFYGSRKRTTTIRFKRRSSPTGECPHGRPPLGGSTAAGRVRTVRATCAAAACRSLAPRVMLSVSVARHVIL